MGLYPTEEFELVFPSGIAIFSSGKQFSQKIFTS